MLLLVTIQRITPPPADGQKPLLEIQLKAQKTAKKTQNYSAFLLLISDKIRTFVYMKQVVTDTSEVLKSLTEELDKLRKIIAAQNEEICTLNKKIDDLNVTICKKDAWITELEKRLGKYEAPGKNSNNSSTPPSKEKMKDEIVRRTNSLREKSDCKPGGQVGHKGHTLVKTDKPDVVEEATPSYCNTCGHQFDGSELKLDYITQIISLPEIRPIVKEIKHYVAVCKKCGARTWSYAPKKLGGNAVVYDASVKSLVVYLSVVQFLPYGRIDDFLREVCGLTISEGSMVNWINEAKVKAQPIIKKIQEFIMQSRVVGFDESGCYCNKRLDWAWIAQTVYFTLLFRAEGRGGKELESRFGDSLKRMIAVTDRHSAYFALHFLNHQVCLAHLLRELKYLNELDKTQHWSQDVEKLLQEAIHERHARPQEVIEKEPWLKRLDALLEENLEGLKEQFERLRKGLVKCRDYIFTFFEDPLIHSDNNASERGIRKLKIKLKNSGTFRSDLGADAFFDLHSVFETAKKHGQTAYKAIRALFGATESPVVHIAE